LQKKPKYPEALSVRALVFEKLNRIDEALADLATAISEADYRPERFYKMRAEMFGRLQRPKDAEKDYIAVLSVAPKDADAIERLIGIHIDGKNQVAAERWLEKLIAVNPSNPVIKELQEKIIDLKP